MGDFENTFLYNQVESSKYLKISAVDLSVQYLVYTKNKQYAATNFMKKSMNNVLFLRLIFEKKELFLMKIRINNK